MNIGNESTFMAGSALAGGVARGGETCGALTGVLMAIGIVAGRKRIEDVEAYQSCMKLAIEARELFRERLGNTLCAEIQKGLMGRSYKMSDPREREQFHNDGGHARDKCPGVCGKAAVIAAEIVFREGLNP
jgi:C_GCAxxG_C_C family probable redox protein